MTLRTLTVGLVVTVSTMCLASGSAAALFAGTASTADNVLTAGVLEPSTDLSAGSDCLLLDVTVTLSWTPSASPHVDGYRVFRAATPGGPYEQVGSVPGGLSTFFVDTAVVLETTYYYVVRAYYASWTSAPSAEAMVTTVAFC